MTKYSTLTGFLFLIILLSCSERGRDNIFDPQNDRKTIDIGFSVTSQDTLISLFWNSPRDVIYRSFNIYRKADGQAEFELHAVIPKGISIYNDYEIEFDRPYSYYLTINGETEESYPTKTVSITPGPGSVWMLDRYLWEIVKLSYDLSSTAIRKAGAWRPENLELGEKVGLITYPTFRYLEIFNTDNGNIIDGNSNLRSPFDAAYDPEHGLFWVVDSIGSLYKIDTSEAGEQLVTQELSKPVQIEYLDKKVYLLDQGYNKIFIFNTTPFLEDSITFTPQNGPFENLKLIRIDSKNKNCYILDGNAGANFLYRYNLLTKEVNTVYSDSLIYSFDINRMDETIWIVSANKVNSELLQLSNNGERLHSVDGFIRPTDVKINPFNGNVVIADFFGQKVYHYRPDLTLVGVYSTIGDPSKVYIE
jgi:hypothetical protein